GERVVLDEQCLGLQGPVCPACHAPLEPAKGLWVPRNPDSAWGDGFTINHLSTPWLDYPELLERSKSYHPAQFRNECLGLPVSLGDHVVTRAECEACCDERPMARGLKDVPSAFRHRLIAGIDWGGGVSSHTVLVIGYMTVDNQFVMVRMD